MDLFQQMGLIRMWRIGLKGRAFEASIERHGWLRWFLSLFLFRLLFTFFLFLHFSSSSGFLVCLSFSSTSHDVSSSVLFFPLSSLLLSGLFWLFLLLPLLLSWQVRCRFTDLEYPIEGYTAVASISGVDDARCVGMESDPSSSSSSSSSTGVQCLILEPTRDLAMQTYRCLETFGRLTSFPLRRIETDVDRWWAPVFSMDSLFIFHLSLMHLREIYRLLSFFLSSGVGDLLYCSRYYRRREEIAR